MRNLLRLVLWAGVSWWSAEGDRSSTLDRGDVDKHAIFALPLTQGAYNMDAEGFVPTLPLKRLREIHKEMVETVKKVADRKKQIQHILAVCDSINKDLDRLKEKLQQHGIPEDGRGWDKSTVKADALIFLAGHSSLMAHFVLYFPDTMKPMLGRNPDFDANIQWAIQFTLNAGLIKDDLFKKPLNFALQELDVVPKDPDYHNPYRFQTRMSLQEQMKTVGSAKATTKKPRKKLQRGPRLSEGEL